MLLLAAGAGAVTGAVTPYASIFEAVRWLSCRPASRSSPFEPLLRNANPPTILARRVLIGQAGPKPAYSCRSARGHLPRGPHEARALKVPLVHGQTDPLATSFHLERDAVNARSLDPREPRSGIELPPAIYLACPALATPLHTTTFFPLPQNQKRSLHKVLDCRIA